MYTVSIRQLIFRRCKTVAERLKIGIKGLRPSETCHTKVSDGLCCHNVLSVQQAFVQCQVFVFIDGDFACQNVLGDFVCFGK